MEGERISLKKIIWAKIRGMRWKQVSVLCLTVSTVCLLSLLFEIETHLPFLSQVSEKKNTDTLVLEYLQSPEEPHPVDEQTSSSYPAESVGDGTLSDETHHEIQASRDVSVANDGEVKVRMMDKKYDLRRYGPFELLKEYRNPCWLTNPPRKSLKDFKDASVWQWLERQTRNLNCLPYFYLAGFPKCGTTDLWKRITSHPSVARTPAKEPHWITRNRFNSETRSGLDFYTSFFVSGLAKARNPKSAIVGDGSASTFWDNHLWERLPGNEDCSEPCVIVADYVRHLNPDVKIIISLRNPTDRLYSEHCFFHDDLNETHFHENVVKAIGSIKSCLQNHSWRHCAYGSTSSTNKVRIHIGLYHVYIKDWLQRFPRDQLHIIRMEDMKTNLTEEVSKVFSFLGLSTPEESLQEIVDAPKSNVCNNFKRLGPIMDETRRILDEFYRPHNEQLAQLLHDKKFLWLDTKS